jgi:hypothetical protein
MSSNLLGFDAFGANIFFTMFSSAKIELPVAASTGFLVFQLSMIGVAIYTLVRAIFKLPAWISFVISLGVVGGNFFIFIATLGLFAQLIAANGYLAALIIIVSSVKNNKTITTNYQIFFPLLFLLLSYQAVFIVYFSLLVLAKLLIDFFDNDCPRALKASHIIALLKNNIKTFLLPLLFAFIISPQNTNQFFSRVKTAATQWEGYRMGFLDPVLFTGTVSSIELSVYFNNVATLLSYIIFFILIFLLFFINKSYAKTASKDNCSNNMIDGFLYLFVISIIAYLLAFHIIGDTYQIWKFASFSILPLAFIPSSLFFSVIYHLTKYTRPLFFCSSI